MDATKLTAQEQEQEKRNSAFPVQLSTVSMPLSDQGFSSYRKRFIKDLVLPL